MHNGTTGSAATVLVNEGATGKHAWKQIVVIQDCKVTILEMVRALLDGWNVHRIVVQQGQDSWSGMSHNEILAWKLANHPSRFATPSETAFALTKIGAAR